MSVEFLTSSQINLHDVEKESTHIIVMFYYRPWYFKRELSYPIIFSWWIGFQNILLLFFVFGGYYPGV